MPSVISSPCFYLVVTAIASTLFWVSHASNDHYSVLDLVKNSSQHQRLASWFEQKTDLGSAVSTRDSSVTLFAPTDNDFATLPAPYSFYVQHKRWHRHLHTLLSYHIVAQAWTEKEIFTNKEALTTLAPNDTISVQSTNKTINGGAIIITPDIQATNGYLQITSRVLLPNNLPKYIGNVLLNVVDQDTYSNYINILTQAARMSGIGSWISSISESGVTLFLPTNRGFSNVPEAELEMYLNDTESAIKLAAYHVASTLIDPQTYSRRPLAISMLNGLTSWLYGDSNNRTKVNTATVTNSYLTANGVVNVIDEVLEPLSAGAFLDLTTWLGVYSCRALVSCFGKAGLNEVLEWKDQRQSSWTFLVPVDSAFDKVRDLVTRLQQPIWNRHWHSLLLHHVADDFVSTKSLAQTRSVKLRMMSNFFVAISVSSEDENIVVIHHAPALSSDFITRDGVIHVIDQVLLPPSVQESIYQRISEFSTLRWLLELTGLAEDLDSNEGPLTLLAPTDAAFVKVGNLANFEPEEIRQILMRHLFASNIYVSDLDDSTTPNLISQALTVTVSGNNTYVEGGLILDGDNLASNGVYHEINRVLMGSIDATEAD